MNSYHFVILSSELMLLGFISLLLTASSSIIANICIPSKFYNSAFAPCSRSEIDEEMENKDSQERKLLITSTHLLRRMLNPINRISCKEAWPLHLKCFKFHYHKLLLLWINVEQFWIYVTQGYEPFVSYEGLEQLHRFIFVMAVTHVSYSCLTMLLAIVKVRNC